MRDKNVNEGCECGMRMRMRDENENSEETNLWQRKGGGIYTSHLLRRTMIGDLFVT